MKSMNTWFGSISIYSIIAVLVLFEFGIPAYAQSNSQSGYSPQQLKDLQEFARQFRADSTLQPPTDATSVPQPVQERSSSGRVPAFGASYAIPRQGVGKQEQVQDQDNVFDPFQSLRSTNESKPENNSILDPSPEPPVDEKPNQVRQPQTQEPADPRTRNQDQSNPFSDDRAVDNLRDLDSKPRTKPRQTSPRQRKNEDWEALQRRNQVTESAILQWELPPGSVVPGDRSPDYQRSNQPSQPSQPSQSAQPRQPRSRVEPYYPQQHPKSYQPTQPNYGAQPGQSEGQPQQPYDPNQSDGYQANPYQTQPYQNGTEYSDMNTGANTYSQAGQGNYFEDPNSQWGVAGVSPTNFGSNSCGFSDCGFDCEELEFYLSGYGASVDLKNLISGSNSLLTDMGGGWGLAIGRRQGLNLRTELEYGWRSNNVIGFDEDGMRSEMTGKIKSQAGMANAYWEFVNFPSRCVKPYVGAGLGFARFDADLVDQNGDSLTPERSEDSSFAYQFMGGINYQPSSTVDLFIEYRLFQADSFQLDTAGGFASGKYNYETENLVGGLRWKF